MKKIAAVLCAALILLASASGCGKKQVLLEQPENLYVADCAQVLSEETEAYVVARVQALREACGGEIAVVTLDYLNDLTAEEYAYTLFNQWGIGDKQKNNGMVVLIVIGEDACWLTPGYGIEDDFPSTLCSQYLGQYLWQYQHAGDCDTGVKCLIDALIEWYGSQYGFSVANENAIPDFVVYSGYGEPYPESPQEGSSGLLSGSGILVLLAIGFAIFLLFKKNDDKTGYWRKRSYFLPIALFNLLLNSDSIGTSGAGYSGSFHSGAHGTHSSGHSSSSGNFHVGGHSGGGGSHGGGGGFRG